MKVVSFRSPKLLSGILRLIFGIKNRMVCNSDREIHTKCNEPEAFIASGSLAILFLRLCIRLMHFVAALFQETVNSVGWVK